jgi:hypothetical protein
MTTALQIIATCLYAFVAMISLVMALKSLRSREFLPFHEAAAQRPWTELGSGLQAVILALLRLTGLGFLVVALQLGVVAVAAWFSPGLVLTLTLPLLSLVFCSGLCAVNFRLHRLTGAQTPWQAALYATVAIVAALVVSLLS